MLVGAAPAVLATFKVTTPWLLGIATVMAALALVAAALGQERFKRLAQRGDEQRFKIADGLLTHKTGRVPKVRQVHDPLPLGIHPSAPARSGTQLGRRTGSRIPAYVSRDIDAELRDQLGGGGFVLLVGDSTAGKSRTAFEVMRAHLPGHELFVPGDKNAGKDVLAALVERIGRSRRAVLWLDDLEHFLRSGAITPAQISRIRNGKGHKVILATLRSAEEDQLTQLPPDADGMQRGLGDQVIQVLEQAQRLRLQRLFSPAELKRARAQISDERIADAVSYANDYGVAEYLAAGPHLQDAFDNGWSINRNPRGAALVAAAIDCRRCGYVSPISRGLLEELHQDYLDERGGQRLRPESLEQAWEWATRQRRSTASLLEPVAGDETAVEVFDYLVDRLQQQVGSTAHVSDKTITIIAKHSTSIEVLSLIHQLYDQGRFSLALSVGQQVLRQEKSNIGNEDLDTLSVRDGMGLILAALRRFEEAEVEHSSVLAARRELLGEGHPDVLTSRSNLALTYSGQGRYEQAVAENGVVLGERRAALGGEHIDTLVSWANFAGSLRDMKQFKEALDEYEGVLAALCRTCGEDSDMTLQCRANLAIVLSDLGQQDRAESILRAVLEMRLGKLGEEHPKVLHSRAFLAHVLLRVERFEEAKAEYLKIIEVWSDIESEKYTDIIDARAGLAQALTSLWQMEEAEKEYRTVLKARADALGEGHPNTVNARIGLGLVLIFLRKLDEAEGEFRMALAGQASWSGVGRSETMAVRVGLGFVLWCLKRQDEAKAEYQIALDISRENLGENHQNTISLQESFRLMFRELH
ncbi:tetratricopeptide repeat protein [Nonomuraea glycinis]|uniref:tetratricopeptide repeat protein n=1 Tax=Nonomuraea glycinis TaxID=2047744 RepID=UPI0033B2D9F9